MSRVLIATSCRSENARYIDFYRMRDDLIAPEGSKFKLYPGFFPDYNINDAVEEAIKDEYTHLFIVDDDQMLPPDTLMRLLAHNLNIVSVNLLMRTPPFAPYIFRNPNEKGVVEQFELPNGNSPVIQVDACGAGGILIDVKVLLSMEPPWFSHDDTLKTYDLYFCKKARELGYKIHVDLSCPSGHLVLCAVWPERINGEWKTTLIVANQARINFPAARNVGYNKLVIAGSEAQGAVA